MLGSPTPTKQTRWPASSRAAATIIISERLKALGRAARLALIGTPRSRPTPDGALPDGRMRSPDLGAQLLHVLGAAGDAVDPLVEPGVEARGVAADGVPVEIEAVVAVVVALRVRGMRAERLDHHGVDDEARG